MQRLEPGIFDSQQAPEGAKRRWILIKPRKSAVCYAVQFALARQVDEAEAKAEREELQAMRDGMKAALVAELGEVEKRYGGGLVDGIKAGFKRLRGLL